MNENNLLVSVIMPVYNAERYLSEAIESVLNQTYTDFELLLINDRSTDKSKEICQEYAQKDNRIVLLENDTENHGPGSARNIGLDNATGEFIIFVDADDWIDKNLLQYTVRRMQETNADIVFFGAVYENNDGNNSRQYCWQGKQLLTKSDIKNEFINLRNENLFSSWIQLFRSKAVKGIRFEKIINGEDLNYRVDALAVSEIIAFVPEILYHYRYVEGSTSRHWNKDTVMCREAIWKHQKNCFDSLGGTVDDSEYSDIAYENYLSAINQMCLKSCPMSYKDKKSELFKLKEIMDFDEYRNRYPFEQQHGIQRVKYALVKYRLEGILLLLGPVFLKIVRRE